MMTLFFVQNGITEKVKGSIATMLTLASSQGDALYKELAGKYKKPLHNGCFCCGRSLWD